MNRIVSWLDQGDHRLLYFVNNQLKCSFLDWWMPKVTHLGGATSTISLFMLLFTLEHFQFGIGLEGLISLSASHLIVHLLKKRFNRHRPYLVHGQIHTFANPLKDYSFPSGHTTAIFSVATTLSLFIPAFVSVMLPVAVIVGLSRIYLGLHYPTDVIIGAFIGSMTAIIIHSL